MKMMMMMVMMMMVMKMMTMLLMLMMMMMMLNAARRRNHHTKEAHQSDTNRSCDCSDAGSRGFGQTGRNQQATDCSKQ